MGKTRKQITFDIDTNVAKEMFGDNYTKVYDDMEHFFKQNDFKHDGHSVYLSNQPMYKLDLFNLIASLTQQYPYMEKCVMHISFGNSPQNNSLDRFFSYDGTAGQYKKFNLPLPPKKKTANDFLKKTVTFEEATELYNKKIPFHIKKMATML